MTNNIKSAAVSDRGLSEKRPQNEDSYLELPEYGLFVVADGVGGAQAGDVASQMAVETLQEAFANLHEGGDVEDLMKLAIERANEAIYQTSHELTQLSTMATTIVALHVAGNIATIGHVGDSRLYRMDDGGNLFRETQDHSMVEEEVRAGRMTAAQAAHHPSKNIISRALGAEANVDVDLKTMMFEPNTTFLLCSDGITRHVEDHEIRELLKSSKSPAQVCEDLKNICYGRGAEDNLTAVVLRADGIATENTTAATTNVNLIDTEENTVATARSPLAASADFSNSAAVGSPEGEIPTQDLRTLAHGEFKFKDDDDAMPILIPASENAPVFQAGNGGQVASDTTADNARNVSGETSYANDAKNVDSGVGRLLTGLLLGLLIGLGLGAAYHFLNKPPVQPPQVVQETPKITQMQTPNIAYSAFEDNRRNVDKNPAQFVAANGTTAKDAEDYYLLGRAFLLQEKYVDAKNAFTKAKDLLPQMNGDDKIMLGNEIAIGLSIVDSTFSKKVLEAAKSNISPAAANQTGNTNVSTEIKPSNGNSAAPSSADVNAGNF